MRFSISKKLMLAFLGLTLVVLIATLGLARWSFERGFLDYVNALEQSRLESISNALARDYAQNQNSWSGFTQARFNAVLRAHAPRPPVAGNFGPEELPPLGMPPPTPLLSRPGSGAGPRGSRPPAPAPGEAMNTHIASVDDSTFPGPPTSLFSVDGTHLAGALPAHTTGDQIAVPVTIDGDIIGELRSAPRRHFESPQETAFSRQQWMTSLLAGITALLLAIAVSLLLTRVLLAPIRRMIAGVSALSSGEYSSRLNEKRDDELGLLMNNLDKLAIKLEENRSSRQRWLADISHELRTPVTALTCEIETMKDGIRPLDMEQLLSLDQEVARLRHLIEDLYQLSLSDAGGLRYSFAPISMHESVNNAVALFNKRAQEKNVDINVTGTAQGMVNGDSQRLEQLFVNLLENALAYTDAPGRIEITLVEIDHEAQIIVADTPPGVAQADCLKLFDPLYRQDSSRSRRKAGAGLGLAICRNIVIAHQGSIAASPSELGGLKVEIKIPLLNDHGNE